MDTTYGLRGIIKPSEIFKGSKEEFQHGAFRISIEDGVLEIGYDDSALAEEAKRLVENYRGAFALKGMLFSIDLDQSWERHPDGIKLHCVALAAGLHMSASVGAVMVGPDGCLAAGFDSRRLSNHTALVRKAEKDPALQNALKYISEEVLDSDRPLYGVYKAVEELTSALGKKGRQKLAKMAGHDDKYVGEVMQTATKERHHSGYKKAQRVLTDAECRDRARRLIEAYVQHLPE